MKQNKVDHKTLHVKAEIKDNLTQRDLEAFGAVLASEGTVSLSQKRGANVRAAIQAGWFKELQPAMTVEQVAEQSPVVIRLLADWIDEIYDEVTTIPPE